MAKVVARFKDKSPRHFIRQWRKYRGLTLERLAERVGVTHGALSQLERGEINYTQPTLEALAFALSCEPGDLITFDPTQLEALRALLEALRAATPDQQKQIVDMTEVILRKTG